MIWVFVGARHCWFSHIAAHMIIKSRVNSFVRKHAFGAYAKSKDPDQAVKSYSLIKHIAVFRIFINTQ